ncbi:hypothetical protein V5F53_00890 [Xanthobacter sp. V4C-4]|uniref:hypothetical protein n=1 Tax=Xanthobacter cornucopiae TaxID=3119924 RepID=UPI0037287B65
MRFVETPQERAITNARAIAVRHAKVFRGQIGITNQVVNLFRYNEDLRQSLNAFYRADLAQAEQARTGRVKVDPARRDADPANGTTVQSTFHKELAATIAKYRDLFPAEEFSFRIELAASGALEIRIPAAAKAAPQVMSGAGAALALLTGNFGTGASAGLAMVTRAYRS